jgi:hypothetical protein
VPDRTLAQNALIWRSDTESGEHDGAAPIDGSASARGEAPPIVAFPTPPAIKTDPRPNVAARRSALMV